MVLSILVLYLPAPGIRGSGNGMLWYVGSHGFSWSSSVTTGLHAYHLHFNFSGILPNYYYHRAYGLQLRCLQE
ncbi:MAG: hypothetical protein K2G93_06355 [Rikenella sp.]|nr:hypothetical protein [Rikenella sp.]